MAAPVLSVETFAEHLTWFCERVDRRRRAIEARPAYSERLAWGKVPAQSLQFWEDMRAAIARRQVPVDEPLARACERTLARLGRDWLDAARRGDAAALIALIEEGFPIAYSDPRTGETALHAAAGSQARPTLRVLLPDWRDFLVRDRRGRLASELAYLYGEDPAMARLLAIKERKYAVATGREVGRQVYVSVAR